jgi:hypothetical protein
LAILPRSFVPGDLVKMKGLIEATAQHLAGRIDDQPWQSLVERQIELAIDGIDAGAQILRRREFDVTAEVAREACAIGALSISSPAPMDGPQTVMKYLGWWSKVSYVVPGSEDIDLK